MRDTKIELIPHRIEAALFAFRSPLSKGVILADEVGLQKKVRNLSSKSLTAGTIIK